MKVKLTGWTLFHSLYGGHKDIQDFNCYLYHVIRGRQSWRNPDIHPKPYEETFDKFNNVAKGVLARSDMQRKLDIEKVPISKRRTPSPYWNRSPPLGLR